MKNEHDDAESEPLLLTMRQIEKLTGLSRTHIWRLRKRGEFPSHVRVGQRRIAWPRHDFVQWVRSLPQLLES